MLMREGVRTGMVGVGSEFAGMREMQSCVKACPEFPLVPLRKTVVKRWIACALSAEACPRQ